MSLIILLMFILLLQLPKGRYHKRMKEREFTFKMNESGFITNYTKQGFHSLPLASANG